MSRSGRKRGQGKGTKEPKKIIAIFCEGESEVNYFKMLQRKYKAGNVSAHNIGVTIKSLPGKKGNDLIAAVKRQLSNGKKINAERVYLVFDRDNLSNSEIEKCQSEAKRNKFEIIFSSINFEIWILLHFEPFTRSYTKKDLYAVLSDGNHFNQDYRDFKGDDYDEYLFDGVATAVKNAQKLALDDSHMATSDPFTNVQRHIKPIFGRDD